MSPLVAWSLLESLVALDPSPSPPSGFQPPEATSSKKYFSVTNSIYQDGLYIRRWKYGDRIISATSQKHVLLSDLYINNKLSKYEKLIQPVVVDSNDNILWIPGLLHGKVDFYNNYDIKIIKWIKK